MAPQKKQLPVLEKYELLELIAQGGVGTVYKASHKSSGALVAVKILPPEIAEDAVTLKRLEQEFLVASRLAHPSIVRALDFGQSGSAHYLVLELVVGESLGKRIERQGALPEHVAVRIMIESAEGLHLAHQHGLIHRDIKPDNILLTAAGRAKLTDFGIVKQAGGDLTLTSHYVALGTPNFMPPEQFADARNATVRCDVYSLAATLYMAVTGELPFKAAGKLAVLARKINNALIPPRQLVPSLSARLERAIFRAVQVDPEQRPGSCPEFIADLTGKGDSFQQAAEPAPAAKAKPAQDHRAFPRRRSRAATRYRSDPHSSAPLAKGILVDLSQSGIGLLVQHAFKAGDLIEIEIASGSSRLQRIAEVRWVGTTSGALCYHLGCHWQKSLSYSELQQFV